MTSQDVQAVIDYVSPVPLFDTGAEAARRCGDLVDTIPVAGRHDLTDEQWSVLEPLLVGRQEARTPADMDETAAHRRD
jgi:hypothetical protein